MSYFYKIEEAVGAGRYIVLEGLFETEAAARAAISRHQHHDGMRAVLYRTGGYGPIRADLEA